MRRQTSLPSLGSNFTFQKAENPGFQLLNSTIGPYPGWLKGDGALSGHPCATSPEQPSTPLFQSNQISSFTVSGRSAGYDKRQKRRPAVPAGSPRTLRRARSRRESRSLTRPSRRITKVRRRYGVLYLQQSENDQASGSNPIGPYLTVASCTQSQSPNRNNTSRGWLPYLCDLLRGSTLDEGTARVHGDVER